SARKSAPTNFSKMPAAYKRYVLRRQPNGKRAADQPAAGNRPRSSSNGGKVVPFAPSSIRQLPFEGRIHLTPDPCGASRLGAIPVGARRAGGDLDLAGVRPADPLLVRGASSFRRGQRPARQGTGSAGGRRRHSARGGAGARSGRRPRARGRADPSARPRVPRFRTVDHPRGGVERQTDRAVVRRSLADVRQPRGSQESAPNAADRGGQGKSTR